MHIHLGRRSWIAVTAVIVVFTLFVVARNALHAVKIKGQINRLTREELLYREQIGRDSMLLEQLRYDDYLEEYAPHFYYQIENDPSLRAFLPFLVLFIGFVAGFPVFLVGLASAIVCMLLSGKPMREAEAAMLKGVSLIATPIVATIGFLFMSTVIKQVGLVQTMSDAVGPVLSVAPVLILFGVAFLTGFLTQSYAASVSVLVPFLQVVLQTGADPFAACFAAASGASLIQYFLTGGQSAGNDYRYLIAADIVYGLCLSALRRKVIKRLGHHAGNVRMSFAGSYIIYQFACYGDFRFGSLAK